MIKISKNPQTVYNKVAKHLLTQRKKSKGLNVHLLEDCLYYAPDGAKCAVGCLIPKSQYHPCFEGQTWTTLVELGHAPYTNINLIGDLQSVHDNFPVKDWKKQLLNVANAYGLKTDVLKNI